MPTSCLALSSSGSPPAATQQPTLWGHCPLRVSPVDATWEALDSTSSILHQPHWLMGADRAFHEVLDATEWRSMRRPMYDRVVDVPRLIATARRGDVASETALGTIVLGVEHLLGGTADHVGLNLYRSGADSVTWHRDRIGRQRDWSVIALVSLGGPRVLSVRPWSGTRHRAKTRHIHLASGDLLVMAGACQRDWEHAVLKTTSAAPRISIALRSRQFPQGPLFKHLGVPPLTD
jgi:alkylated DNA repair dioxygenase AlkB